ncbi:MAG: hypothetical protein J7J51_05285 [Candidatus Omnitrophica bacterium]|nr:hypothetical protein [Candidatus Omnitrophota bacterium]
MAVGAIIATTAIGALSRRLLDSIQHAVGLAIFTQTFPEKLKEINIKSFKEEVLKERAELVGPEATAENFAQWIREINLELIKWYGSIGLVDPYFAGIAKDVGMAYIWSYGFGWLSWAIMSPIIQYGITKPLEDYYKLKYRPRELTPSQVLDAWRRGIIDRKSAEDFLRRQGYSEEFIKVLFDLEKRELSRSELDRLYKYGLIDDRSYIQGLIKLGYKEEDAELMLSIIKGDRTEKERDLTKSEILSGYKAGIITKDDAMSLLTQLGYSPEEAEFLIALADATKRREEREFTISQISRLFKRGIISEKEAINYLTRIGYLPENASLLVELWKKEAQPKPKILNLSTIKRAYLYNVIDAERALNELKDLGYSEDDAKLLISLWDKEKAKEPRKLTSSIVLRMYRYGIISREEAVNKLLELGYEKEDAERLVKLQEIVAQPRERNITRSDVIRAWKNGWLTDDEAIMLLQELGYSEEEAIFILMSYTKRTGGM